MKKQLYDLTVSTGQEPALFIKILLNLGLEWIDCGDNRHSVASLRRVKMPDFVSVSVTSLLLQPQHSATASVYLKLIARIVFNSMPVSMVAHGQSCGKWTEEYSITIVLFD